MKGSCLVRVELPGIEVAVREPIADVEHTPDEEFVSALAGVIRSLRFFMCCTPEFLANLVVTVLTDSDESERPDDEREVTDDFAEAAWDLLQFWRKKRPPIDAAVGQRRPDLSEKPDADV